ncbi:hypothetical protein GCM10011531_25940 [Aquaticitalea lipolytica]|jgi:hypothetical protein|uniref:DUF4230 domain-containing protein n=1 Tax=Aquaticitalea lipolytica TaxID=1247562 RepID=A0A8J2XI49_9FLAO|nr:DUF4230 domain-containing protein [Aquaticitalea lipolytica]GFZ92886.1 hypothetical protein GCM10011531_25940 [Aquaticitalea lipolytica]
MRKIVFGIAIALIVLIAFKYCSDKKEDKIVLQESSALIQEQIKNVGKLIVTEGHLSEVFNYKNSKEIFGSLITSDKKALVVVNADVFVSYDLSLLEYEIDEATKTLTLISIPEEEIKINPDFEYYDIQADYFNAFEAKDYNDIKETVKKSLLKKIENSDIKKNAKNRLISELSKFYILTNSLGWTLKYNENIIENTQDFQGLKL